MHLAGDSRRRYDYDRAETRIPCFANRRRPDWLGRLLLLLTMQLLRSLRLRTALRPRTARRLSRRWKLLVRLRLRRIVLRRLA